MLGDAYSAFDIVFRIIYFLYAGIIIALSALCVYFFGNYLLKSKDGKNDGKSDRQNVMKGLNFYLLK